MRRGWSECTRETAGEQTFRSGHTKAQSLRTSKLLPLRSVKGYSQAFVTVVWRLLSFSMGLSLIGLRLIGSQAAELEAALLQGQQQAKGFVPAPAIDLKVIVQRQNIGGFEFIRQANQAGVGEIDLSVSILSQNLLYANRFARKLKWNLENPCDHVFDYGLGRAGKIPQQVAALRDHRFTRD